VPSLQHEILERGFRRTDLPALQGADPVEERGAVGPGVRAASIGRFGCVGKATTTESGRPMVTLTVVRRTTYHYRIRVGLDPHRLMLRRTHPVWAA